MTKEEAGILKGRLDYIGKSVDQLKLYIVGEGIEEDVAGELVEKCRAKVLVEETIEMINKSAGVR